MTLALANPRRRIRKLLLTENAARRLADENIDTRIAPEIVRPARSTGGSAPDAVHQGLLAEADPLPSPDIETLAPEGIVLVLDQITDPHNVGAILRTAAGVRGRRRSSPPRATARRRPACWRSPPPARSNWCRSVTVQNLARALTTLNERGFMTVGLDSDGRATICATRAARSHSRWCSAPRARACGN